MKARYIGVLLSLLLGGCQLAPHIVIENRSDSPLYVQLAGPRPEFMFDYFYSFRDYEMIVSPHEEWDSARGGNADRADIPLKLRIHAIHFRFKDLRVHDSWRDYVCPGGPYERTDTVRIVISEELDVSAFDFAGKEISVAGGGSSNPYYWDDPEPSD